MQSTLEVTPKVYRAGVEADVRLRLASASSSGPFRVRFLPMEGDPRRLRHPEALELARIAPGQSATVRCTFPSEQEYVFRVDDLSSGAPVAAGETRVYALRPDLFARLPWKGDFHMHSTGSDGRDAPAEIPAACRLIGMDLMALTDHRKYESSLEAIRAFEGCPTDLVMVPGEEVHPPDNPVHIVNVGGDRSVNAMFALDRYRLEVAALEAELEREEPGVAPEDRYRYASALWCFREIRLAGGLGIFAHPSWVAGSRYDVPASLTDLIFAHQPYDALELIGGYHVHEAESNTLQVARWAEERSKGARIPVVGVSDAHGCYRGALFGWYYTVAFAASPSWADFLGAVKGEWSVAVEARPGEVARVFGPYRLVMYAHFLLRELYPRHDALCAEEGELMRAWVRGEKSAADSLARKRGAVRALYRELWARGEPQV